MKRNYLLLFLFAAFQFAFSQTSTISDGNWNTSGNWSSGVPADGATATITHNMTLNKHLNINDGSYTLNGGSIIDNSGGTAYNIDVRGNGYFEVAGKVIIEGNLEIRNFGEFVLKSGDTMLVKGNTDFRNDSKITIESGAVLIIEGNLEMRNDNETTVNGNISVGGNLTSRNSSIMTGTGNLQTSGIIDIKNSSQIFGSTSGCSPGPCEYGSGIGLPIELTYFDAKYTSSGLIQFNWETATEINNDFFTIEYSLAGKTFNQLKTVIGAGNSNRELQYEVFVKTDFQQDIYVRLVQTDFDGAYKTFNPIYLRKHNNEFISKQEINIHPNPGSGQKFQLNINKEVESVDYLLSIRDLNGQLIYEEQVQLSNNGKLEKEFNQVHLKSGIYLVSLTSKNDNFITKYIVK
ncbi:MAG: T9SS C-terminal target domain-containing protein [Bacteroidetes bacterium]|nr:MAG: T9SS C-terminal target domain-containing protein [Bacteroidota bacterium]MBL1145222.1 T9SS C-terminal target domain-containing protein [Bacteroidota bacterium]NOG58018.1 T9SS type A sorting domain-containing protein [Bacteroidota bacterium]